MMNYPNLRRFAGVCSLSLGALSLGVAEAVAQTAAPTSVEKDVITLSPFEVNVSKDTGYGALQSNSMTAFSVDLLKMPATAQVFTQAFIDDIGATSIESMLVDYAGTVGYNPNNATAALDMTGDRNGGQGLGIRGLQASGVKRDGFTGPKNSARTATGNTDNFSVERVELIEGPQSLLYGAVGGGGVINSVSKRANFNSRKGTVRFTVDNYGDTRSMFDYNFGADRLAVRVAGVAGKGKTERFNLSNQHDFDGLYAQIAYRVTPKITVRVLGERTHNLAVFNDERNFDTFLPVGDPRRGKNTRYLALTGQLSNVTNVLQNEPLTYDNYSSMTGWWTSEKIGNDFLSATMEAQLGAGFSAKVVGVYSETIDQRSNAVNSKTLLAPLTGGNPYNETAFGLSNAGFNEQLDRSRGVQVTLLHDRNFKFWRLEGRSQTAAGVEFSKQGPSFGSSGFDTKYYQADANWNVVINPAITLDYGRIPMPTQFWTVGSGIQTEPLFNPYVGRVTINGVNYITQRRILYDPARVSDTNLFGLIPNNPTTANPNQFAGNWNAGGFTNNRLVYLANVTEWFDGRLMTVAGVSINTFDTKNFGPTGTGVRTTILPERDYNGYSFGGNYGFKRVPGLRFYATLSTAGLSAGTTKDYLGEPLKVPKAKAAQPEIGLKWSSPEGRYIATFAYNPTTEVENETQNAGSDFFNAVNPNGINGRFNGGDQWINLNREANSMGLAITANPTRNWRMRFSATKLDGQISSTVKYDQLYNDQFYLNSAGTVTYKDGTEVMVNALNTTGGAKDTPLTLAMINNPSNAVWYARPDSNSGSITNTALRNVLMTVDPVHGTAATNVTGLPISAIQYTFTSPHGGTVTVVSAGEKNTGINEYSFNFQNSYEFSEGGLKGLSIFFDARSTIKNRAYYTIRFPTATTGNAFQGVRELYRMPDNIVYGLGLSYKRKLPGALGGLTWSTQLNIRNLFDRSNVIVMPSNTNAVQLRARLDNQPRQFVWSNSITF